MVSFAQVKKCDRCDGYTEFYCFKCRCNLCLLCKHSHIINIDTQDHYVTLYREKTAGSLLKQETCVNHPGRNYDKFCTDCALPTCFHCRKHRNHQQIDIKEAYIKNRNEKYRQFIKIRSEFLVNARALRLSIESDVRTDVNNCYNFFFKCAAEILTKSQNLKDLMDSVQVQQEKIAIFHQTIKCIQQREKSNRETIMTQHILNIRKTEHKYERAVRNTGPVQFLKFMKRPRLSRINNIAKISQHCVFSLERDMDMEHINALLNDIQIRQSKKRQTRIENLLKLIYPEMRPNKRVNACDIECCCHVSCMSPNTVWASDENKLISVNQNGELLFSVHDSLGGRSGFHTLNRNSEMIYISNNFNIKKLARNRQSETLIMLGDNAWEPVCIYCSKSTGNILIAMKRNDSGACKIAIYQQTGKCIIQHENTVHENPMFICENTNSDIVVSDSELNAVLVTDCLGNYRFSYKGPDFKSFFKPGGICTDALSHILVCDVGWNSVNMISKDGVFLLNIAMEPNLSFQAYSLCYDCAGHLIWIGLENSHRTISVYRYINRNLALTDESELDGNCFLHPSYSQIAEWYTELFEGLEEPFFDDSDDNMTEEEEGYHHLEEGDYHLMHS